MQFSNTPHKRAIYIVNPLPSLKGYENYIIIITIIIVIVSAIIYYHWYYY